MARRERAVTVDESGSEDTPVVISVATGKNTNYMALSHPEAAQAFEQLGRIVGASSRRKVLGRTSPHI